MRILFLNSAKEWGGNEKWTVNAACGLADRGHDIFLGLRSDEIRKHLWSNKVNVVEFPFTNNADLFTARRIYSFIRKEAISIVIPTKQREYLLGGLAGFFSRDTTTVFRLGINRPLHNRKNRFAFIKLADAVLVNSRSIVEALSADTKFDTRKCRLLHNGVEIPSLSSSTRDRYRSIIGATPNETVVIGIGRLAPQKRFDLAIEAFSKLCANTPSVKLVIVGEGSSRVEYERMVAEKGLSRKVVFAGYREDLSGYLQAADIFWLTSQSEGMPNALMEAMAHGKPVFAFDVAGVSEVVVNGESGVLVPFGDTEGLARETATVLHSPDTCASLCDNALARVRDSFSLETMHRRLEEILSAI